MADLGRSRSERCRNDFFRAEHAGQATHRLAMAGLGHAPRLPEYLDEEEVQSGDLLCYVAGFQLPLAEQLGLLSRTCAERNLIGNDGWK
jgi:hypothetical protein